jgi:hypothetical protein
MNLQTLSTDDLKFVIGYLKICGQDTDQYMSELQHRQKIKDTPESFLVQKLWNVE